MEYPKIDIKELCESLERLSSHDLSEREEVIEQEMKIMKELSESKPTSEKQE